MDSSESEEKAVLSPAVCEEIDQWVAKYPADQKQSAVMSALRIVQDDNGGWLTTSLMDEIADYLEMPAIAVYEVASFYSMYELKPVGKVKVCICTNISCMLNGSGQLVRHLEEKFDIKLGEMTEDGQYSLKEVECLGACGGAPVVQIGRQYYENITPEIIDSILDKLD